MTETSSARKRWITAGLSLGLFVLTFFVFDHLLLFGLRAGAARYYASLKADKLRSRHTSITGQGDGDLLIFGSSRARYAFGQDQLSNRLNKRVVKEAAAGRFPKFFYYFYMKYRTDNAKPKVILYGLDYFMFEKKSAPDELARLDKSIKLDSLNPADAVNPVSPLLSRISWLYRKKPDIDNYLGDVLRLDRRMENGGGEDDRSPAEEAAPARTRPMVIPYGHKIREGEAHLYRPRTYMPHPGVEGAFLERLLADLEEEGILVFLVILPDYTASNYTNFEQQKYKGDIQAMARPFNNAVILDFNRPDRFDLDDPSLFWNGDWGKSNCHLSNKGMREFSRRLGTMIRARLVERAAPNEAKPRSQT